MQRAFDAVRDDAAAAVCARGRELVDRAFERVERPAAVRHGDGERLVVVVAAGIALGHGWNPDRRVDPECGVAARARR